jgi:hypothetical protein
MQIRAQRHPDSDRRSAWRRARRRFGPRRPSFDPRHHPPAGEKSARRAGS